MVIWKALLGVLLHCLLPEALAQPPAPPENCSSKSQKISFSHSYKIDMPKSSQFKVEPGPQPLQDDSHRRLTGGEMEEGEEQNIIFRHNIRLQAPKGDCEVLSQLKALLERMEKTEMEVAQLRETCSPQRCCGRGQGVSSCSGHGTFIHEVCSCNCDEGWEGQDCSKPTCPGNCHGNGRCVGGVCVCSARYAGEDCSQLRCPEDCSGNGLCIDGICHCYEDFTGEDCSEKRCPRDCSGNGYCDSGECYCEEGFTGLDCSKVLAPWNVRLLKTTEDSLAVGWDKRMDVDYYLLSYFPVGREASVRQVRVPKDQHSHEILQLVPGTKYVITVRNVKKGVSSDPELLQASTAVSAVGPIWVTGETENSLEVEWENPPTGVDRYKLRFSSLLGEEEEEEEVFVPKSRDAKSRYVITGLKPGMQYKITIVPVKDETEGKPSSVHGRTAIDGPTNLTTSQVTEGTATISWSGPQAPIDRYVVRYASLDGHTNELTVGKDKRSTTLVGLKPGTEYAIFVGAVKGSQQSKKASTKAETEIDPPRNVGVSDVTQASAVVTWMPPDAQISGYLLTYQEPDGTTREVRLGPNNQKFMLEGLTRGTKYIVYITAFKGDRWSRKATTTFSTVSLHYPFPADCSQIQQNGHSTSGIFTIYLSGDANRPVKVYCEMTTDRGGWLVIQRRNSGQLDFFKRWRNYVEGFGDPSGEFWLGLEKLHELTGAAPIPYELRVDLRTHNESVHAVYDLFQVGSSKDRYRLAVGKYRGTAGDALTYHNGWKFTTWDRDNDIAISNCAIAHHGGWWYKNCHLANLNGKYGENKHSEGINWEPWKGHLFSIPFTEMKIRPRSHSTEPVRGRKRRSLAVGGALLEVPRLPA
ncbi:tenascin-N [Varanus komodoensis]|uniref:tenascin-N n=1 Tax=Varanus komodoensis TaxID=61221 RepID=UPI001CF7B64C|nr:tenascin-N [Varanus komodoensis]